MAHVSNERYLEICAEFQAVRRAYSAYAATFGAYLSLPLESRTLPEAMEVATAIKAFLDSAEAMDRANQVVLDRIATRLRSDLTMFGSMLGTH